MNTEVELTGVAITPTGGAVGTEESSKKRVNFNSLDDTYTLMSMCIIV